MKSCMVLILAVLTLWVWAEDNKLDWDYAIDLDTLLQEFAVNKTVDVYRPKFLNEGVEIREIPLGNNTIIYSLLDTINKKSAAVLADADAFYILKFFKKGLSEVDARFALDKLHLLPIDSGLMLKIIFGENSIEINSNNKMRFIINDSEIFNEILKGSITTIENNRAKIVFYIAGENGERFKVTKVADDLNIEWNFSKIDFGRAIIYYTRTPGSIR